MHEATPSVRKMLTEGFARFIGILSLTEVPTNSAMWAHYAENHKGFLLGFATCHEFFNRQRSEKDEFNHLRRVQYIDRSGSNRSLMDLDGNDIFFTKSTEWAYEREWRMITPLARSLDEAPEADEVKLLDYPASALSEVVIGASSTVATRNGILDCLRDVSLSHVQLRAAHIDQDSFGLVIRDFCP